jgi:diguanylate cyclase
VTVGMFSFRFSIRLIITLTIIFMGLQGLVLALLSGDFHREHTLNNHRATIQKLVKIRSDILLGDLSEKSVQLGLSQQHEQLFKNYLQDKNIAGLQDILNEHFHRYFVTAGILKLEKIAILQKDFSFLAESTEGETLLPAQHVPCADLLQQASKRTGPDRLKAKAGLCAENSRAYHVAIAPVGGLVLKGYMVVITDPVINLANLQSNLGMPFKIDYVNGENAYISNEWYEIIQHGEYLSSVFSLNSSQGSPVLRIEAIENIAPLYEDMPHTRVLVMIVASLLTFFAVIISIVVIHKTTLNPLRKLTEKLASIRNDQARLGERLDVKGTAEIQDLANSFNDMTAELDRLYNKMEQIAYTDQLTNLANRHLFNSRLSSILASLKLTGKSFALFMMDLNKFKLINDTLGHKAGDKVLQEVATRLTTVLRACDSLLRVENQAIDNSGDETIARLGGDEFSVILLGIDNNHAASIVADKLINKMKEPFIIDDHRLDVGISIGIALFPRDADNEETLLHNADMAMYDAKNSNKQYVFYNPDADEDNCSQSGSIA